MTDKLIAGVDFSGAKQLPNQTWLAIARMSSLGVDLVELRQTGSHKLAAEVQSLGSLSAVGMDFPFSLPADFLQYLAETRGLKSFQSWQDVAEQLIFTEFEEFLSTVKKFGRESKRLTDKHYQAIAKSPMHLGYPTMIQMTYQGMRLLAGLDPSRFAILPFNLDPGKGCAVLEVFPRGTLWCLGLPDSGYKSKEKKDEDRVSSVRKNILDQLLDLREKKGVVCREYPRLTINKSLQHTAIDSDHALDAVIACYTAAIWAEAPALFEDPLDCDDENVLLEGWIYAPLKTREQLLGKPGSR